MALPSAFSFIFPHFTVDVSNDRSYVNCPLIHLFRNEKTSKPMTHQNKKDAHREMIENRLANCKRVAQSARPGPEKAVLSNFVVQLRGPLVSFLVHFSIIGTPWERCRPAFNVHRRVGPPKLAQEAPPPKDEGHFCDRCGIQFLFVVVDLLGYVFKHRLLLSSGIQFHGCWQYVDSLF